MKRTSDSRIAKWGNSFAVRLPKRILDATGLKQGDRLEISVDADRNILIRLPRRTYSLDQLLAGMSTENQHPEIEWGPPTGEEAW